MEGQIQTSQICKREESKQICAKDSSWPKPIYILCKSFVGKAFASNAKSMWLKGTVDLMHYTAEERANRFVLKTVHELEGNLQSKGKGEYE